MVEAGLVTRILILDKSRGGLLFFLIGNEFNGGYLIEDEIRQGGLVLVVGSAHLNAESDAFVGFPGKIEDELHVVGQLEAAGARLDLAPGRSNVQLLSEGKLNQVLDGLGNVVRFNFLRAHVGGDVGDQALAVVRHGFLGRSCGHDDVIGGDKRLGRILGERALVEPVGDWRAGAEVVFVPVVGGNEPVSLGGCEFGSYSQGNTAFQKVSTLHGSSSPVLSEFAAEWRYLNGSFDMFLFISFYFVLSKRESGRFHR